jgi:hypothetical protein
MIGRVPGQLGWAALLLGGNHYSKACTKIMIEL